MALEKLFFYFWTTLSEHDTEVGRAKGYVLVLWRVHKPADPDPEGAKAVSRIRDASPFKIAEHHICLARLSFNLDTVNKMSRMFQAAFQNQSIIRVCRSHFGTAVECKYRLLNRYGCPVDCFPDVDFPGSQEGASFHKLHVKKWIAERLRLEYEKNQRKMESMKRSPPALLEADLVELFGESNKNLLASANVDGSDDDKCSSIDTIVCESIATIDSLEYFENDDLINDNDNNRYEVATSMAPNDQTKLEEPIIKARDLLSNPRPAPYQVTSTTTRPIGNRNPYGDDVRAEDVLLGKSAHLRKHSGNMKLREMVVMYYDHYYASYSDKYDKTGISEEIVRLVACSGGRFLKQNRQGSWVEVGKKEARNKVSITFRNITKREQRSAASVSHLVTR